MTILLGDRVLEGDDLRAVAKGQRFAAECFDVAAERADAGDREGMLAAIRSAQQGQMILIALMTRLGAAITAVETSEGIAMMIRKPEKDDGEPR